MVNAKELLQKGSKRKLTGNCDMGRVDPKSHQPRIIMCRNPAPFYKPEEVGMFGAYVCHDCFEAKYLKGDTND